MGEIGREGMSGRGREIKEGGQNGRTKGKMVKLGETDRNRAQIIDLLNFFTH